VQATTSAALTDGGGTYAVNIGSGVGTTVKEVAHAISRYYGNRSSVRTTAAFREGDIRHGLADLSLARELLGYEPKWSFGAGLSEFLNWAAASEPATDGYKVSLDEMKRRGLLHEPA
jgi:dTDP-L-rhamnose 4-epimerase